MTSPAIVREVTQADRDAAAALTGDEILAYGMADLSSSVQAFARHRIAALADATPGEGWQAGAEAMREMCVRAAAEQRCERETPWDLACVAIIDAIRDVPLPTPAQTASGVEG